MCAVAGALLSCTDIFDTDFGRHIAYGRLLLQDFGAVRSATMGQSPEITQQAYSYWLYEALLALVFDRVGPAGVVLLRAIVLGAAFLLAVLLSRRLGASLWSCAAGLALALLISYERFLDRPEIFSFLAWAGSLWILIRRRRTRSVWLLVPLQILWVNTHLWFGLLPVLCAAFAVGDRLEGRRILRNDGLLMGALVLATFIGPAGPGAWSSQLYIARFLGTGYSLPFQIGEMMSPFSGYGADIGIWCFRIALPLVLILAMVARRRLGWGTILALIVAAVLAARARRAMPLFGITALAVVPMALTDAARRFHPRVRDLLPAVLMSATIAAGLLGVWSLLTGRFFLARSEDRRVAFALSPGYPALEAARFIQREGIVGPIFNPPLTAGALVLMNGIRVPPFLDARWVGSPETITAYAQLRQGTDGTVGEIWKRLDDSRRFEAILLDFEKLPALLRYLSLNESDWVPVHTDDRAIVFCRRGGKNASVVDREAGRIAQSRAEQDPAREAARARRSSPSCRAASHRSSLPCDFLLACTNGRGTHSSSIGDRMRKKRISRC